MARSIDQAKMPTISNGAGSIGFFALPVLLVVALVALAMTQPAASNWISEAVQAEFVGADSAPVEPTQLAQPVRGVRTLTQVMN